MEKLKPRTLSGFMELLPAPQQKFERMLEILRKNFALYGFAPIDTPIIESAEILLAKGGGETEKQIYRFQKGDSDLALRFEAGRTQMEVAGQIGISQAQVSRLEKSALRSMRNYLSDER